MQEILLNDLLHLTQEQIANSKIELNMQAGRVGEWFIDRWLQLPQTDKEAGTGNCSYWGWYGRQGRNFRPGQWVFSFARMASEEWLFISAAKIEAVPEDSFATVTILDEYKSLFGRMIIRHNKGNTYSRYVFNMSDRIGNCTVKEILPCIYSGERFEGYDNVNLPFRKLKSVFGGEIMPTYYEALKKITGVYCLTDMKTGKLYIGSATGGEGVAQRWGNYLDSKHGGNKKLVALYQEKGAEYFEEYFTFTLLEYFGLSYDPEAIKAREQYWKCCLGTIKHGYNDN